MPVSPHAQVPVAIHLTPEDMTRALRDDVRRGLTAAPKELPPKWFYDARGSLLFEEITRLPEYYPTRRERALLAAHASEIAALTSADTLIELGSGSADKTRLLLDALREAGHLHRYVPVDVSESALRESGQAIAADYRGLEVECMVADFERHLGLLPTDGRRLTAFLGGTIGNLTPDQRADFLGSLAAGFDSDDALLLGTDLVKGADRLVAAYDDSAGVTADFNKNVLHVINRELDADFDVAAFDHVARWDPRNEVIEMRLRARSQQVIHIDALNLTVEFATDETVRTEISAKFRRERVEAELASAGLALLRWWTDPDGDYGLSLAVPA